MTWLDWLNCVLRIQPSQNNKKSKHTRIVKTIATLKHALKILFLDQTSFVSERSLFFRTDSPAGEGNFFSLDIISCCAMSFFASVSVLFT